MARNFSSCRTKGHGASLAVVPHGMARHNTYVTIKIYSTLRYGKIRCGVVRCGVVRCCSRRFDYGTLVQYCIVRGGSSTVRNNMVQYATVEYGTELYGTQKKQTRGSRMHGRAQHGTVRKSPARHNFGKYDPKNRIKGTSQKRAVFMECRPSQLLGRMHAPMQGAPQPIQIG